MEFHRHIPNFIGVDPRELDKTFSFNTTDELLAIEFVALFRSDIGKHKFSHFALAERHLVAVYDDGFWWWVVGDVSDPAQVQLPQWAGGKYRARFPDGTEATLEPGELQSSRGDVLTLRDGRTATNLMYERPRGN